MKLYNTLTQNVEELKPLEDGKVKLYTCGLTVYSQPHIGNWLGYVYWDVLVRTLRAEGYSVERTQNITDVGHLTSDDDAGEDKMEKGARSEGMTAWDVAEKYISIADREAAMLGLVQPDHLIRATAMIDQQISFAKILDEKGFLYELPDDGMYFDTSRLKNYGELARLNIEGLEAGARVSVEGKRNITDFAVWKFSPKDAKRDMEWPSPWGTGFPGWHLECSVIARETLGDQIDIHTGGIDHIPVHHINEIAQTEAVTGKQFSQFWVHNNHLKADGKKMSKSLGNIYTLQDILDKGYDLDSFRLFSLGKHYRTEGNFTWDNLEAAANRLKHWRENAALFHQPTPSGTSYVGTVELDDAMHAILSALRNDLDTTEALNSIEKTLQAYSASERISDDEPMRQWLAGVTELTGIRIAVDDITDDQKNMLSRRLMHKEHGEWERSDSIRHQLTEQGVGIRDTPTGSVWYRL